MLGFCVEDDPEPERLRRRSIDSFRCSSTARGGYGDSDSLALPSLLRVLGTVDSAGGDKPLAADRGPVSDALVRRGECADAPRLRARRWPSPRSRSGTGDGDEDANADELPVKLSLLSGVAIPGGDADEGDSPAAFLNIDRSESFPRSRPGVEDVDMTEESASVPADRGRRDDENDGRPEDLTG